MKAFARSLRRNQTDAERVMWSLLRNRQVLDCKFRRQQKLGPYIADFLCMEPKLVIEIDGGQHLDRYEHDEKRSQYFYQFGYKVLRFWNHEVLQETSAVMETIRLAIVDLIPSPQPSPGRRGN